MKNGSRDFDNSTRCEVNHPADYFGLQVEVLGSMPNCSSIRYRSREFIVLTQDLRPMSLTQVSAA
jgi:hypothetical protein